MFLLKGIILPSFEEKGRRKEAQLYLVLTHPVQE